MNFDYLDSVYMRQRPLSDYSKEELDRVHEELKKLVQEYDIEIRKEIIRHRQIP